MTAVPRLFTDLRSVCFSVSAVLLLGVLVAAVGLAQGTPQDALLQEGIALMEARGDHRGAATLFERVSRSADRVLAARALLYLGIARERFAREDARAAYARILRDYADQADVARAASRRLQALGVARSAIPQGVTARRLWGAEFTPTAPPRRGSAQVLGISRNGDIALRDMVTLHTQVISPGAPSHVPTDAAFSPDGRHLAVARWRSAPEGSTFELVLSAASGAGPRVVFEARAPELLFGGWYPDGASVLLYRILPGGICELQRVHVQDGAVRTVATIPRGTPYKVSISPDGMVAALDIAIAGTPAERDIALVNLNSGVVSVLAHPALDAYPVWDPEGRVLFASDRAGAFGLWLQDVVDGRAEREPVLVRRDVGSVLPPAGIGENGALYYRLTEGLVDVEIAAIGARESAPVSVRRAARRVQGVNLFPDWSADGRRVVFTSRRGTLAFDPGAQSLVTVDLESGAERVIETVLGNMAWPRWSPDGRLVAVTGVRNALSGTYLIDLVSGTVAAGPIPSQAGVEWVRTSEALLLIKGRDLVRHRLEGAVEDVIYSAPEGSMLGFQSLAPDGQRIAVAEFRRAGGVRVMLVALDGRSPRELFVMPVDETGSVVGWTGDGTGVYVLRFTPTDVDAPRVVWRVPLEGGQPVRTGIVHSSMRDARVSPDGSRIAYTAGWPTRASWVLEHFLPPAPRRRGR